MSPTPYDPYAENDGTILGRFLDRVIPAGRIRKLVVSVAGTGGALVVWLTTDTHTAIEVAAAVSTFVLTNWGVYDATNEPR